MNRDLSPVAGAPCTAPPIRHADSAEPYCASSPSRARSPVSPCRVDAKPGSPMPPPLQPSGPLRSREDQPSGRVRFQSATWVRITAAATLGLQAAQEVQQVLLFSLGELVEVIDDRVRFRRS